MGGGWWGWLVGGGWRRPALSRVSEAAVSAPPTFLRDQGLEHHHGSVVARPRVHLPVAVPALLRQLVPRLGLRQQLGDGALGQTQHVLGEQPLANVVHAEQLANPPRDVQRVQGLGRVPIHVVAKHLL